MRCVCFDVDLDDDGNSSLSTRALYKRKKESVELWARTGNWKMKKLANRQLQFGS